jgi:flavin reductase (DIM6/NTAB) family NADH-FMN oxidoreductase RutF
VTQSHGELPQLPGRPKEIEPVSKALLQMVYGVHVIGSVNAADEPNAMLADWVMQVSFDPRMVAVAFESNARTLRNIQETLVFTVNLLEEESGPLIARQVVMPHEGSKIQGRKGELATATTDKLAHVDYRLDRVGCPVLDDALAWYSCEAEQFIEAGDHVLVLARVTQGDIIRDGNMLTERELGWEYGG